MNYLWHYLIKQSNIGLGASQLLMKIYDSDLKISSFRIRTLKFFEQAMAIGPNNVGDAPPRSGQDQA